MKLVKEIVRRLFQLLAGLLGLVMLFGGGVCVAIDSVSLLTSHVAWMGMMLVVAIVITWMGWGLIKLADTMRWKNDAQQDGPETNRNTDQ
jgi:hypothetical protein